MSKRIYKKVRGLAAMSGIYIDADLDTVRVKLWARRGVWHDALDKVVHLAVLSAAPCLASLVAHNFAR